MYLCAEFHAFITICMIFLLTDSTIITGFASFELKTSEKPVLGQWKITAHVKSYKKTLQVEIKKFVLPKFKVTITPPSSILASDSMIEAEICAK